MKQCINCGLLNNDGSKFCIRCGQQIPDIGQAQTNQNINYNQPAMPNQTPLNWEQATPSIGQCLKYLVLFLIPVVGWIITIIYICNRKNLFARNIAVATLIVKIILWAYILLFGIFINLIDTQQYSDNFPSYGYEEYFPYY